MKYDTISVRACLKIYSSKELKKKNPVPGAAIDRIGHVERKVNPDLFGTAASLYVWAIAGGAVEGMRDYAPKKK